nr:MAG TPA: hypothetical protein [Caudoviricetes sp.]
MDKDLFLFQFGYILFKRINTVNKKLYIPIWLYSKTQ